MAISTNPKPTIYRNLYENTAPHNAQSHEVMAKNSVFLIINTVILPIMFSYAYVPSRQH